MQTNVFHDTLRAAAVVAFALLLSPASLVGCGGAAEEGSPSTEDTTVHGKGGLVGNPAPNFSAKVFGSKQTVSLKKLRGQVVLVDFWGTFCEPCKKSFPKLQELSHNYADQGFQVVAISEDEVDDKDKIPGFAEAYGAKFILAWDEDKSIARAYKPETMPSSFLVDKTGIVRFAHVGYHDGEAAQLEKEVQELLGR